MPTAAGIKVCADCSEDHPLEDFTPDKRRPDGKGSYCRRCWRERSAVARAKFKERHGADYNAEYMRQYRAKNPDYAERARENAKKWNRENPERVKARYEAESVEWRRERARNIRQASLEHYRQKDREKQARRKAWKLATESEPVDYAAILERDGMHCHICASAIATGEKHHFDHVIPLSRGGAHTMENIKVAHATCNLSKRDRLMEEL